MSCPKCGDVTNNRHRPECRTPINVPTPATSVCRAHSAAASVRRWPLLARVTAIILIAFTARCTCPSAAEPRPRTDLEPCA